MQQSVQEAYFEPSNIPRLDRYLKLPWANTEAFYFKKYELRISSPSKEVIFMWKLREYRLGFQSTSQEY